MKRKYTKKKGHFFPVPNELFSLNLCAAEIAIYCFLMSREDRKKYTCHPSFATIGKALNLSKNTVIKYVRSLEDKELIETERTQIFTESGLKWNGSLMYRILPIHQAVDAFHQRQLEKY